MSHILDNDIAAFNIARRVAALEGPTTMTPTQQRAMGAITERQKEQHENWLMRGLVEGVFTTGTNALVRPANRPRNDLIDHPPALIRFLRRLMRPAPRPEIKFKLDQYDTTHGFLVAYDTENGVCCYPFQCENPKLLKQPSLDSIQRIFSEAILDGYSPHYLKIGDNYYTQLKQITKEQFDRELAILDNRRHDVEGKPHKRVFDFTGLPVISSWSVNQLAYANMTERLH